MTLPRDRPSLWMMIPAVAAVLSAAIVIGDRFWASAPDSHVTAFQVNQLTQAVRDLADKFDGVAKQSSVDALAAKLDHDEGMFSDLRAEMSGVKANVDTLMQARQTFRNPPVGQRP